MRQKHFWSYFASSQIRLVESKIVTFASQGKIDRASWHFQNSTRQCLFCHQSQRRCWSYFAIKI